MADPTLRETLASLAHFKLVAPEVLGRIAAASRTRALDTGEILFREGEPCRAFFVVRAGRMRLYRATPDGREQVVHNLGPGQSFAEAALLAFDRYPVSAAAAETPTEVLEIGGETFLQLLRGDDGLAAAMVASLSMRLLSLVERVEELSLVNAGARLARFVIRQPATGASTRPRVELSMPKKDLAAQLSMTPETLSRLLRQWQEAGLVESERTAVVLLDPARLQRLADGEPDIG